MVDVQRVDDPSDARLVDFTDLRDVQLRSRREPAEGLFLAEGQATIRRALAAGYRLRSVLCEERWLGPLRDVLGPIDAPALVVEPGVLAATVGFPVHRGALASFDRRSLPEASQLLEDARRAIVIEDLTDHTNLGAIFRSAAALSWDAMLLTPGCADPLYRRAIRTSMGAVFAIPWTRLDADASPHVLHDRGFRILALTPSGAVPLEGVETSGRIALALGAEGPGLSRRWLDAADQLVRIPMREGVDSLNVAAAAAIACYVLGRG